jgi:hypothetical protein
MKHGRLERIEAPGEANSLTEVRIALVNQGRSTRCGRRKMMGRERERERETDRETERVG